MVATDGLVIRSKPEISAASEIFRPSLPAGAELYVWDGPVRADGYAWYRVLPLSAKYQSGWVAAASKTGEPWIESGNATCPKTPTTVAGVAQMPGGVGLACFSGLPIALRARIVLWVGSIDPAYSWNPAWFALAGSASGYFVLRDPQAGAPPSFDRELFFSLDPAGSHHDPLPVNAVVDIVGMFDHPAARTCSVWLWGSPPDPDGPLWCRLSFVVTSIK